FQAEDGIRDYKVTGVQTCALPILASVVQPVERSILDDRAVTTEQPLPRTVELQYGPFVTGSLELQASARQSFDEVMIDEQFTVEIGRASCRERGEVEVVAV